ncbi:neurotrypsin-like [Argopecten irradians]|uniref:neurotrypsin-like n=1 Tax=Argopecten irradians TaxID=31199 RepID=UPI003715B8D4
MEKRTRVLVAVLAVMFAFDMQTVAMPSKFEYLESLWKSHFGKRQDTHELKARQQQDSLRLVGGPSDSSGRLEVYHDGVWGTVCDNDFDSRDVRVACRQLGFSANEHQRIKKFGPGTGSIWMDNVECTGDEATLSECPFNGWLHENCRHSEDVGIQCEEEEVTTTPPPPPAPLRLVGGPSDSSGRLEVYHRDVWGTVCNDEFDILEVRVACRQLGFSDNKNQKMKNFGPGSGIIWMDDLACSGVESALSNCKFNGWGNDNCQHSEDVGIVCEGEDDTPPQPEIQD